MHLTIDFGINSLIILFEQFSKKKKKKIVNLKSKTYHYLLEYNEAKSVGSKNFENVNIMKFTKKNLIFFIPEKKLLFIIY